MGGIPLTRQGHFTLSGSWCCSRLVLTCRPGVVCWLHRGMYVFRVRDRRGGFTCVSLTPLCASGDLAWPCP